MLLRFLIDLGGALLGAAAKKAVATEPPPRPRAPDPMRVEKTGSMYRTWADQRGFASERRERYRGRLSRHDVVVTTGLDGSSPVGVEAEIAIELDAGGASAPVVLRGPEEGASNIERALAGMFDDPELGTALRSIVIAPGLARLHFQALTSPRVVERAVEVVVDRASSVERDRERPYRS